MLENNREYIKQLFKEVIIFIDSGHGWDTKGKESFDGELKENEFNTAIENKLSMLLSTYGIEYYLLAANWRDVPLKERSRLEHIICDDNLHKQKIGISIHANAWKTEGAKGFSVFHNKGSVGGLKLAKWINTYMDIAFNESSFFIKNRGIKASPSPGIKSYHILRETKSPFVLIESGFMTNPSDKVLLMNETFRNTLTEGIFRGIINYLMG